MMQEKRKVLIVDDDESCREFVEAIMKNEGWETVTAVNGYEALEMATKEEPDLIIMDVMMPEMNGFEAFRRLRLGLLTKDIPIIMLTSINEVVPEAQYNEEAMEKRFGVTRPDGFVDKPVDPQFLVDTIFGIVG